MYLLHTCIWYICMHICTYNICTYNICIYEREMCVCVLCCYDIYSVARRWIVTHKRWTRHTQVLMWTFCGVRRNSWILIRRTLVGTIDPRQKKTWRFTRRMERDSPRIFVGLLVSNTVSRLPGAISGWAIAAMEIGPKAHDHSKCRKTIHKKICSN